MAQANKNTLPPRRNKNGIKVKEDWKWGRDSTLREPVRARKGQSMRVTTDADLPSDSDGARRCLNTFRVRPLWKTPIELSPLPASFASVHSPLQSSEPLAYLELFYHERICGSGIHNTVVATSRVRALSRQ